MKFARSVKRYETACDALDAKPRSKRRKVAIRPSVMVMITSASRLEQDCHEIAETLRQDDLRLQLPGYERFKIGK